MNTTFVPLPSNRQERLSGWTMSVHALGTVYRPTTIDGICAVFEAAWEAGVSVALRGAGRSYGDAALGSERVVLDLSRMNRILHWEPESGVITVEPGVTIQQLWEYTIGDGWWPPVVPGTMFPTLGGVLAANIHGKNNVQVGCLGDHVLNFDLLAPNGTVYHCSPDENVPLFYAAIGSFGLLGVFTKITLQLKRVYSGLLRVVPHHAPNLPELFCVLDRETAHADYAVGWLDGFARGTSLGRGLVHAAYHLPPGEDRNAPQTLRVDHQRVGDEVLGVPKSALWRVMRLLMNDGGMRLLNRLQYNKGKLTAGKEQLVTHAAFAFMLDYVPNWKRAYGRGGLLQYQSYVPAEPAQEVFARQLAICQRHGLVPYLAVFKRHRASPFLLSYLVDGYSLALDFKVTRRNRQRLYDLAAEMDTFTLAAGGRIYFAKDQTLHPSRLGNYLTEERVQQFLALKRDLDPANLLQTDLYRRIFTPESAKLVV